MKKPNINISKVVISNGSEYTFGTDDKVVIVGPNNSGKSQFLRDILSIISSISKVEGVVVKKLETNKNMDQKEFLKYLERFAEYKDENYILKDWRLRRNHVNNWNSTNLGTNLSKGFIKKIAAEERLNICQQQESISLGEQKSKPQHLLYDDSALMEKVSGLFYQAFNKNLMFDFRGGRTLPIHIGSVPTVSEDRVSDIYVEAVRAQPLLDEQGDGMKSYAGILFESVVANKSITLIDEPEAFLHPPQMKRLGETLATEVKGQLFVATHSSDILHGFLEGTKGKVRIFRIQRKQEVNIITEAMPDVLLKLWEQPNLRYSKALDGIFYEQTIICEDDSDCRLIHAMADHLEEEVEKSWKDTAYVPAGGKYAIPKIVQVLKQVGVPVKAVFDLDFLSEKRMVKETVESFGGCWANFERSWSIIDNAVRNTYQPKPNSDVIQELKELVHSFDESNFDKGAINKVLKNEDGWKIIKKVGSAGIPRGDAAEEFDSLISSLEQLGIYLVPVGEMENFSKETPGHGPKFVANLLEEKNLSDTSLSALSEFVQKVHLQ